MIKDLEEKEAIKLLSSNYLGRLAYLEDKHPFVIPITYFYDPESKSIISYASPGHKINAMRKNSAVSLEVDEIRSMKSWQSVLVKGKFEELKGIDAKYYLQLFSHGVSAVIAEKEKKQLPFISDFSSKIYSEGIPVVYRIVKLETIGKSREP